MLKSLSMTIKGDFEPAEDHDGELSAALVEYNSEQFYEVKTNINAHYLNSEDCRSIAEFFLHLAEQF